MILALEILAIISILFFIGMTVAFFIIFIKIFHQLKYRNYILENLNKKISEMSLSKIKDSSEIQRNDSKDDTSEN